MPSLALKRWRTDRSATLNEIERAHRLVGGAGPGRFATTQQLNQAYALLLSSQFQGFCRDLHQECADYLVAPVVSPVLQAMYRNNLLFGRKLDAGNPNPGNIGTLSLCTTVTLTHPVFEPPGNVT